MIEAKNITRAPSLGLLSEVCGTWLLISSVVNWFKMVDEAHVTACLCDPKSLELIEKIFLKSTTELKQEGSPPWARNSESTKTDGINLIEETNKNTHRKVSLWRQYKTEWGSIRGESRFMRAGGNEGQQEDWETGFRSSYRSPIPLSSSSWGKDSF